VADQRASRMPAVPDGSIRVSGTNRIVIRNKHCERLKNWRRCGFDLDMSA